MKPTALDLPSKSTMQSLKVGGITPLTTIDFPGHLAAVIFCQGCPWRCGYCQNGHLIPTQSEAQIPWTDVMAFLQRRQGLLDGVIFSGGEPTLQAALIPAIQSVKKLGFKVGLHSAGIYPERLKTLLSMIDWVGLDIKALPNDYDALTGVPGSGQRAWVSAKHVINSGVDYEIRTTVHPGLLGQEKLEQLTQKLLELGASHYRIQTCQIDHCLNPELQNTSYKHSISPSDFLINKFQSFSLRQ